MSGKNAGCSKQSTHGTRKHCIRKWHCVKQSWRAAAAAMVVTQLGDLPHRVLLNYRNPNDTYTPSALVEQASKISGADFADDQAYYDGVIGISISFSILAFVFFSILLLHFYHIKHRASYEDGCLHPLQVTDHEFFKHWSGVALFLITMAVALMNLISCCVARARTRPPPLLLPPRRAAAHARPPRISPLRWTTAAVTLHNDDYEDDCITLFHVTRRIGIILGG